MRAKSILDKPTIQARCNGFVQLSSFLGRSASRFQSRDRQCGNAAIPQRESSVQSWTDLLAPLQDAEAA